MAYKTSIYISLTTKDKAKQICMKYKVSLSTLSQVLVLKTIAYLKPNDYEMLQSQILDEQKKGITYIKPKLEYNLFKDSRKANRYISNMMYLFVNKKLALIYDEKTAQKVCSAVNSELQKKREIYWDLNNVIRQQKRANTILGVKK